ncbi:MAG: nucleotidyltransferase [Bacteroidetes bacterium RIFCSPLOWO2_12_FULL_31_6]|nr:MAG: nucleotidyltransferase [Bacteroidetes bacterium RIFCSPLOWO2_12_FULL_31_6]
MIPQTDIMQWGKYVPWKTNEQIEQDLIICRALIEIFNDNFLANRLAFRGGTALHKLYIQPQPRYSEDIDLVQMKSEPIKETIDVLRDRLAFLGIPVVKQKQSNNTLIFRFQSEFSDVRLKLKIETNCREHFTELGWQKKNFTVKSNWFKGSCDITTYKMEELLGTKLRALYQRRKGRDLFDLYKALTHSPLHKKDIILCFKRYMKFSTGEVPSQKEFIKNMNLKLKHPEFLDDILTLLSPDEKYDQEAAYELVKTELIERI